MVRVAGPGSPEPGRELQRVPVAGLNPDSPAARPFDVCWIPPGVVSEEAAAAGDGGGGAGGGASTSAGSGSGGGKDGSGGGEKGGEKGGGGAPAACGVLAVTLHKGHRKQAGCSGAVALLRARDGALLRLVTGKLLNAEPNMVALLQ